MWNISHDNEKTYVKYRGPRRERERLRSVFRDSRNLFDRAFRKARRDYERQQRENIEHFTYLNNLKPKTQENSGVKFRNLDLEKKQNHIDSVLLSDGRETSDHRELMYKWKHDFEKMFMEQNGNFDDNFLAYVNSINEQWDHNWNKLRASHRTMSVVIF